MKTNIHSNTLGLAAVLALAVLPVAARAQGTSLSVGNSVPVQNALGRNWLGSSWDSNNASRVEIRETWTAGTILAPTNDPGEIETFNPLVRVSYLGCNSIGANPGLFASIFEERLSTNVTYYARVFDAPTVTGALYYADSTGFSGPPDYVADLNVAFGPSMLVRTGAPDNDTDGDGIPDELEGVVHTDPTNPDTDGDGYDDWFEAHYSEYLSPTDPDRPLEIQIHDPQALAEPHTVSWWTIPVPDMEYQLEYTDALPYEGAFTAPVTNVTATDTNLVVPVEDWVTNGLFKGFFRVKVPYEGP